MAKSILAIGTFAAAAFAVDPPTFAADFYSGTQSDLAINQGGYNKGKGIACCSLSAESCKVQTESTGGDLYEQGTMNRSRSDSPVGGLVVTWGHPVYKKISLAPGSTANSSHAYVCAQFCPNKVEFASTVRVGDGKAGLFDKPKYKGNVPAVKQDGPAGQVAACDLWQWTETILGLIPVEKYDYYVNVEDPSNPLPWYQQQVIEPLGTPIGGANESFLGFTPGDQSDMFDIDPDSITKCPESKSCAGQPPTPGPPRASRRSTPFERMLSRNTFRPSYYATAEKQAAAAEATVAAAATPAAAPNQQLQLPTFAKDWTTDMSGLLLVAQGTVAPSPADPSGVCCDASSSQCQVQVSASKGTTYYDVTNNRTRSDDLVAGTVTVDLYTEQKTLSVNATTGACISYCPLMGEVLEGFAIDPSAKDIGPSTVGGVAVEGWEFSEFVFKVIKMQTTDMYVDQTTDPASAVPVFSHTVLTPLGKAPIGYSNQTWSNVKKGPPDATKFAIAGADTCPQGSPQDCGSAPLQLHRAMNRQYKTFWSHLQDMRPRV
jgi:hypothetical protein